MKKLFTLIAVALVSASSFAGIVFHVPANTPGLQYEMLPAISFLQFNASGKWYVRESVEKWVSYTRTDGAALVERASDKSLVTEVARDNNKLSYDFIIGKDFNKATAVTPIGIDLTNDQILQWNSDFPMTDWTGMQNGDIKIEASGEKSLTFYITGTSLMEATITGCGSSAGVLQMKATPIAGGDPIIVTSTRTDLKKKANAYELDTLKLDPKVDYKVELTATANGIALIGLKLAAQADANLAAPSTDFLKDVSYGTPAVEAAYEDSLKVTVTIPTVAEGMKDGKYYYTIASDKGNNDAHSSIQTYVEPGKTYDFMLSAPKLALGENKKVAIKQQLAYVISASAGTLAAETKTDYIDVTVTPDLAYEINKLVKAGKTSIDLDKDETYQLNAAAKVDTLAFTVNGNGAKIVATGVGQIVAKKSLTVDNVNLDATAATVAPIALAPAADLTPADTLNLWTYKKVVEETYTAEEALAYNTANAEAIAKGEKTAVKAGDVKVAGGEFPKYAGATKKNFEAQLISIKNSNITVPNMLIDGTGESWALRTLSIDNCKIDKNNTNSIKSSINASSLICMKCTNDNLQHLIIKNSTLADGKVSSNFIISASPYAAKNVWGTADAAWDITLKNNTFVNFKSLLDRYQNSSTDATFTATKNIYAKMSKVRNRLDQADKWKIVANPDSNVITSDLNDVKFGTLVDAAQLKVAYTPNDFMCLPNARTYAAQIMAGDSARWYPEDYKWVDVDAFAKMKALMIEAETEIDAATQAKKTANPTEYAAMCVAHTDAGLIVNDDTDAQYLKAMDQCKVLRAAIDAWKSVITGINSVDANEETTIDGPSYNLAGQRVNASAKGLIIRNGKKYMNR